jgi:hypothetical protein
MEVLPLDLGVVYLVLRSHHRDKMVGMVHLVSAEGDIIKMVMVGRDDKS